MLPVASDTSIYSLVLLICCQFKFITFQNHLRLSHFTEEIHADYKNNWRTATHATPEFAMT